MKEFIQAELRYFGHQQPAPLKLHEIVAASTPELAAEMVFTKLPLLFAARIKHIESLDGWEMEDNLIELRHIFHESFKVLRLMELQTSDMSQINSLVLDIRERHRPVTPLLSSVLRNLYRGKSDQELQKLDQWAEVFMKSRISTEMLTAHFSALMEDAPRCSMDVPGGGRRVGIVDICCDPGAICQQAAAEARRPFEGGFADDIRIEVKAPPNKIEFSYIPKYLRYIVQELLENSIRATLLDVARQQCDARKRPIQVMIAADNQQVAICIRDKSGGLPTGQAEQVWSYALFTGGRQASGEQVDFRSNSPLSGKGLGLPLSRLYASYLGGSLEVMNVTGVGVDAYLFLDRIDPHDTAHHLPA